MRELHLPWLELAIALPALGAMLVSRVADPDRARRYCLAISGITLLLATGAWWDFAALHTFQAHDRWDIVRQLLRSDVLVVDELSAPLLPMTALLYFLTILATLRTKVRRFSFAVTLASQALLLTLFSCTLPWVIVLLLAAGTIPPYIELVRRHKPKRVYALHMGAFVGLLLLGQAFVEWGEGTHYVRLIGVLMLTAAVLLRNGVVPVHCWMTDLFEHASFGTALLFVSPMIGAYGAMRLVLPVAPDWVLGTIAMLSLFTAVYAAGMALVQRETRRFFTYLFLSNSSLVLVGLELATPIGLTGALCVWLSVSLSLTGFGLTLRSVEARTGRLSLSEYHGLYDHVPKLAAFFLLTGLASIGFPGTIGFVGMELLVDEAVQVFPYLGALVVLAAALNGLAVLHIYFRLFTGRKRSATIDLRSRLPERVAILVLTVLIIGGGLWPQTGVASRYHAAVELISTRERKINDIERSTRYARQQESKPQLANKSLAATRSRQTTAQD